VKKEVILPVTSPSANKKKNCINKKVCNFYFIIIQSNLTKETNYRNRSPELEDLC